MREQTGAFFKAIACFAVLSMTAVLSGCGGGGGSNLVTPPGPTATELTARGWTSFESGNLVDALADFNSAIQTDAGYGPAYVGQGWCRLEQATTETSLNQAISSFDAAVARQQTGAEVELGIAAARFGLGGANLPAAVTAARAARQADANFVFAHRPTLTAADTRLIEAFALAGQADVTAALAAADSVQASGIRQAEPATWAVDGTSYATYQAAVLAFLQKISNAFAG